MPHTDVDAYIAAAQPDQQPTLLELREMIRAALPGADESMGSARFPVYQLQGAWVAGLASRGQGPMLYIMDAGLLGEYEDRLGHLRTGNSCIRWAPTPRLPLDELRALGFEMLAEAARRHAAAAR